MKHTPTPWKVIKNKEEDRYEVYGSDSKDQNACDWIMCDETYYPTAPTIEDAEYIVQCVNSHDELLEAAKWALDAFSDPADMDKQQFFNSLEYLRNSLEKAIKNAEAK